MTGSSSGMERFYRFQAYQLAQRVQVLQAEVDRLRGQVERAQRVSVVLSGVLDAVEVTESDAAFWTRLANLCCEALDASRVVLFQVEDAHLVTRAQVGCLPIGTTAPAAVDSMEDWLEHSTDAAESDRVRAWQEFLKCDAVAVRSDETRGWALAVGWEPSTADRPSDISGRCRTVMDATIHSASQFALLKRKMGRLVRLRTIFNAIRVVSQLARDGAPTHLVLDRAVKILLAAGGYNRCFAVLNRPKRQGFGALSTARERIIETFVSRVADGWHPPCEVWALDAGRTVLVGSTLPGCKDCPFAAIFEGQEVALVAPVLTGDARIGVLGVVLDNAGDSTLREPLSLEMSMLEWLGQQIGSTSLN